MIDFVKNDDIDIINNLIKLNFQSNLSNNLFEKIIVFKLDNKLVGFLVYSLIYERIEIDYILVFDSDRRKKIGTKLLNHLFCLYKNIENISLEVSVDNEEAISFYKKNDFEIKAIRKNYYQNNDGYLMVRKKV